MNYTPIDIKTLIIVAKWSHPTIFQGFFSITRKESNLENILIFRCECYKNHKFEILDQEFFAEDYQFTYLQDENKSLELISTNATNDCALNILKYALELTLKELVKKPDPILFADELAIQSITHQALSIMMQRKQSDGAEHIGFEVATPFNPSEKTTQNAVELLLGKM